MRTAFSRVATAALCILATVSVAHAQDFPTRSIRVIVGPGPDIIPRLFGPKLTDALGQQVVIEPRPGAGGVIAAQFVASAPADGYTLLQATASYTINTALQSSALDMRKDFAPVTLVSTIPFVLVVHPSVPAKTLSELIAYAKANPGKLNYSSAGIGTPPHLIGEMFKHRAGIDVVHIPYKGGGPSIQAVIAGETQYSFENSAIGLPHAEAGNLRALAMTSEQRSPQAPDVPTMIEAGVPGYRWETWFGLLAPGKTPRAIVNKLNREITRVLNLPESKERWNALGAEPVPIAPQAFDTFIAEQIALLTRLARAAHIKAD